MQTVIEITEGAELPSEQNPASELADFAEQICGVADPRLESIAVCHAVGDKFGCRHRRLSVDRLQHPIPCGLNRAEPVGQLSLVEDFVDPHLQGLVGVEGRDPAFRRPEGAVSESLLFQCVELLVDGEENLCAVGHTNIQGRNAARFQVIEFGEEGLEVEGDGGSDDVDDMRIEDTGREDVQRELAVFVDDGVPGIRATLKPDDRIGLPCQMVGHLAFPFVPPVGADDRCDGHGNLRSENHKACRCRTLR